MIAQKKAYENLIQIETLHNNKFKTGKINKLCDQ